jgi:hypothetical protein
MGCSDDFRPWTTKAELHTDAERLRARVAALEAAVLKFGKHKPFKCEFEWSDTVQRIALQGREPKCTCGLDAALQQPQDAPTGAAGRESTVEHAGAKQGGFAEGE